VFIKLGSKQASKDEIGLVVFKVLRKLLLTVWILGLLHTIRGYELLLGLLLIHSVGYNTQSEHTINKSKKVLPVVIW
jgi:hypothetical protein